jgi:hypothetical protein
MPMMKHRKTAAISALLAAMLLTGFYTASANSYVETRVYRKSAGKREYLNSYYIVKDEKGLFVRILSTLGEQIHLTKELWLDENYGTLKWKYQDMREGIDILARRIHNTIYIKGVSRGKDVNKKYTIDTLPWKQQFPFDLEGFIESEENEMLFWSIGVNGPADMRMAKLVARKEERAFVQVNGEETDAIRVSIRFAGLLSPIWHGSAWYRVDDGSFIYFRSSPAPGHTPMELEIIGKHRRDR